MRKRLPIQLGAGLMTAFVAFAAGCSTSIPDARRATNTPYPTYTPVPTDTPRATTTPFPTYTYFPTWTYSTTSTPTVTFTRSFTPINTFTATQTGTATPLGYVIVAGGNVGGPTNQTWMAAVWSGGALSSWTSQGALPTSLLGNRMGCASDGGYVYTAGGDDSSSATSSAFSGAVATGGNVPTWNACTPMPSPVTFAGAAVNNYGVLYVVGGQNGGINPLSSVYAGAYSNGSFSGWASNPTLPVGLEKMRLVSSNGYLFAVAGNTSSGASSVIYRASAGGTTVGTWTSITPTLPLAVGALGAGWGFFGSPGSICAGGGATGADISTIYQNTVDASGNLLGSWNTVQSLPNAMDDFGCLYVSSSFNGYVYSLGGYNGTSAVSTVYYAPFHTGTLSSWTTATASLPAALEHMAVAY